MVYNHPDLLHGFQQPQRYTLIEKYDNWARVCNQLTQAPIVREFVIQHSVQRP